MINNSDVNNNLINNESNNVRANLNSSRLPDLSNVTKKEFEELKKEYITERLQHHYPSTTTVFYSITFFLIGIYIIGLQTFLIINDAYKNEIYSGLWGIAAGFICIFNAVLQLNLSNIDINI